MELIRTITSLLAVLLTILPSSIAHTGAHNVQHMQQQQPTSFSDPNVIGDQAHLKEHMQGEVNTDKSMTPEEMEFHYFRLHDTNNDSLLDGLELLKALSHMMPPHDFQPHEINGKSAVEVENMRNQRTREMMVNYVQIIDNVLRMDDRDQNGYLSYPEYSLARRRDAQKMQEMQEKLLKDAEAAKNELLNKQNQVYNSGL